MTIKSTDQKPKGICEGHWRRTQRPKIMSLPALCFYPYISWQCWQSEVYPSWGQPGKEHCEGCPAGSWGESCSSGSCMGVCWRPPSVAQCAEPVSQWPVVLPSASVGGGQGEWPQVKGEVAHAWFPELQTETLAHEKYQEPRIVPGFSVLDTKWALVSYQT